MPRKDQEPQKSPEEINRAWRDPEFVAKEVGSDPNDPAFKRAHASFCNDVLARNPQMTSFFKPLFDNKIASARKNPK